ncbi:hypothetical protein [Roseateles microcysteis]
MLVLQESQLESADLTDVLLQAVVKTVKARIGENNIIAVSA